MRAFLCCFSFAIFIQQSLMSLAIAESSVSSAHNARMESPETQLLRNAVLRVRLFPQEHRLEAQTDFYWNSPQKTLNFQLHSQLQIEANDNYELLALSRRGFVQSYQVRFHKPQVTLTLRYRGEIHEPIRNGESPGVITDQGVSLLSESFWHPMISDTAPWTVEVELPDAQWKVMMPGVMSSLEGNRFGFQSYTPTSDWSLVADRYHQFHQTTASGQLIQVWLKSNDPQLAQSYLDLVPAYIEDYARLIGPFPFSGYAVIENTLETGYAFPGFTLLGPSVIRLPFLLRSSLPHEVLHSWWGNSVLVDYERGNWCEGLTTYMADRAYAIEDGKGSEYRRASLQNFQDFVTHEKDFPLRRFVSRNDRGTQAVGYGKSMMLFQMLENYLGSSTFSSALSQFFHQNLWKTVGFAELQKSFEEEARQSLEAFFNPWLDQTGAPQLSITHLEEKDGGIRLRLRQERPSGENPYLLPVRVKVFFANEATSVFLVHLKQEEQEFVFSLPPAVGRPQKLWVDPDFEVFRRLYPEETPFAMSQILGVTETMTVSIPGGDPESYRQWSQALQELYPARPLHLLTDQDPWPSQGPVWIIGNTNAHAQKFSDLLQARQIKIKGHQMSYGAAMTWSLPQSAVFIGESLQGRPVVWVWTDNTQSSSVLIQKIKHYTSFSIVGFTNQKNDFKQTWPILASPLMRVF